MSFQRNQTIKMENRIITGKSKDRVLVLIPVFNESGKIENVISRIPIVFRNQVLVVDDGSTDDSVKKCIDLGAKVIKLEKTIGVGYAIKEGFKYFLKNDFDILVIIAGNNKDFPENIFDLIKPIANDGFDLVQGSRYLHENNDFGPMPKYRILSTKLHSKLSSFVASTKITDSTNGFRSYSKKLIQDLLPEIENSKFYGYALEPYVLIESIKRQYKFKEVPARKIYPEKKLGQTKIKPFVGWWDLLRPLIYAYKSKKYIKREV
jgi:dolichol-phosphate mannosyltransferase